MFVTHSRMHTMKIKHLTVLGFDHVTICVQSTLLICELCCIFMFDYKYASSKCDLTNLRSVALESCNRKVSFLCSSRSYCLLWYLNFLYVCVCVCILKTRLVATYHLCSLQIFVFSKPT
jgi:hypothetical protein